MATAPQGRDYIEKASVPVPMKVLLHPFRPGSAGPLDYEAFKRAVQEASVESKRYGKRTILRSLLNAPMHRHRISTAQDSPSARSALLKDVRASWCHRDICASLVVKCWQQYLQAISTDDDDTIRRVMMWMPLWCHRTLPSQLATELTQHGWYLLGDLDA